MLAVQDMTCAAIKNDISFRVESSLPKDGAFSAHTDKQGIFRTPDLSAPAIA